MLNDPDKNLKEEDIDEEDTNLNSDEAHAPLNDVCEKCGRVYCDHENKY